MNIARFIALSPAAAGNRSREPGKPSNWVCSGLRIPIILADTGNALKRKNAKVAQPEDRRAGQGMRTPPWEVDQLQRHRWEFGQPRGCRRALCRRGLIAAAGRSRIGFS